MPARTPITPTYAGGDLASILEIEDRQIEDSVADLTEEQMRWRPNPKAKSGWRRSRALLRFREAAGQNPSVTPPEDRT